MRNISNDIVMFLKKNILLCYESYIHLFKFFVTPFLAIASIFLIAHLIYLQQVQVLF